MSVAEKFILSRSVKHGGAIIKAVMVRPAIGSDRKICLAADKEFEKQKGRKITQTRRWIIAVAHICEVPIEAVEKFAVRDTNAIAWRISDLTPSAEAR